MAGQKNELIAENLKLREQKEERQLDIETLKVNAQKTTDLLIEQANENFERQMIMLGEKYQNAEDDYMAEYEDTMADLIATFQIQIQALEEARDNKREKAQEEIEELQNKLLEIKSKVDATKEVQKREELEREKKNFYRLVLSDTDLAEIKALRSIETQLRDATPLNKVIWKVYYENPYTALIGRVVGKERKTGIYKITNLENGMSYVGQSVDIAERWKQHIKRGIGAEAPTRNKLYPAMLQFGVENFTFEIVEECDKSLLDSREDYYQEFFHTKDFGYSIK